MCIHYISNIPELNMKYLIRIILTLIVVSIYAKASDKVTNNYYIKLKPKAALRISELENKLSSAKGTLLKSVVPVIKTEDNVLSENQKNSLRRIYTLKNADASDIKYITENFDFEYIEEIPEMQLFEVPNDPYLGSQYYLHLMDIFNVWNIVDTSQEVVIGVVDTGVDIYHEDLKSKIWQNKGEIGTDKNGNPKASNGIDDDNNGYIDDWRGWDFYGVGDNNPNAGMDHGTHVAGIVAAETNNFTGIAGVAPHAKIMAIKAASDDPATRSIANGYQGILYAAMMGADVINCSFGGGGYSRAEAEMIEAAQTYGALIVAAAGNDNSYLNQFPASYPGVISVLSYSSDRIKSSFSNYGPNVDICAFGSGIFSTVIGNDYSTKSGTSMASPVVAGVAALIKSNYPDLTNEELGARITATGKDFTSLGGPNGLHGSGEINPYNAITNQNLKMINVNSLSPVYKSHPFNQSSADTVYVNFEVKNILGELTNVRFYYEIEGIDVKSIKKEIKLDKIKSKEVFKSENELAFVLTEDISTDFLLYFDFKIEADGNYKDKKTIRVNLNPSYLEMDNNNITCTFNSEGNIGYNDYSANSQGVGFLHKGFDYLYEGGIIAGINENFISNNARGSSGTAKNRNFNTIDLFRKHYLTHNLLVGTTRYTDKNTSLSTNIEITQEVFQSNKKEYEDIMLVSYDIFSLETEKSKELFFGQFFDWDISLNGKNDLIKYDTDHDFAFAKNMIDEKQASVYVKILSNYNNNFYAISNNGSAGSFGIYDGFTGAEKWRAISSGLSRLESSGNDCSMVFAAGPIEIEALDTANLTYAFAFANNHNEAIEKFEKAKELAKYIKNIEMSEDISNEMNIFPNPVADVLTINATLFKSALTTVAIYDSSGKMVDKIIDNKMLSAGIHRFEFRASDLSQGTYFVDLQSRGASITQGFVVIK